MGNQYGVANPVPTPAVYVPASDVTCTSSTAVTVVTSGALAALGSGYYYPTIAGVLTLLLGASPPSACTVKFILGSGSAVDTYTVEPGLLTTLAELMVPITLVGLSSASAWLGAGATVNVQVTATGQAITCKAVGSRLLIALNRGGDD
jgi:hypothetical protein